MTGIMRTIRIYLGILIGFMVSVDVFPIDLHGDVKPPEDYVEAAQSYFKNDQWGEGKKVLEEGLKHYPSESNLHWQMGRYWYNYQNYDKSRYHLVKAIEANYNNVNAKQLLVNVEEETGHYSSAICYVNELLEVNPYWRGLWQRKIRLYRKQGNQVEADRLLKRINQIYPNDTVLRKDYLYTMEQNYVSLKRSGNRQGAIELLSELLKEEPGNEQYYVDLVNLYLQEGDREKALEWANAGIAAIPSSLPLINKKTGILCELSRYTEALTFVRECISRRSANTASLYRIYDYLLIEAARGEKQRDPYILYGMAYERGSRNAEALLFLLNTAMARGYDDDALYYIGEVKKHYGAGKSVLYKEYLVYKRTGDEVRANSILRKLYDSYPGDYDIVLAMCLLRMKEADDLMGRGLYADALPHIRFVIESRIDEEMTDTAREKALTCYVNLKRYDDALAALETIAYFNPGYESYTEKEAYILDKSGRTREALDLYLIAIAKADGEEREKYIRGYEELAVPYIKKCMEAGATRIAYETACSVLEFDPSNDLALRYAINSAALLGLYGSFREFTDQGLSYYPDEPYYKVKKASVYDRDKLHREAIDLLRPELDIYPDNKELVGAFSQSSEYRALELSREKKFDPALSTLDTALVFDSRNKSLLYTKGLVYEQSRQYDSAYYYQKFYEPSLSERCAFSRQLKALRNRTFRNEVGLGYLRSRYSQVDVINSVASLEYSRKAPGNTYTGRINYSGRDGVSYNDFDPAYMLLEEAGGTGVQLQAEWVHKFGTNWEGMINFAWANHFFPKVMGNISATHFFKKDWELELHAGYRRLVTEKNLISFGPSVAKTLEPFWLNANLNLFLLNTKLYYNLMVQGRYFLWDDSRTWITAMAGVGSAPEVTILDYALPGSFSHANTMVGLGGQYLLTDRVTLGLLGTWYTYFNQQEQADNSIELQYKNIYNIHVQVRIAF